MQSHLLVGSISSKVHGPATFSAATTAVVHRGGHRFAPPRRRTWTPRHGDRWTPVVAAAAASWSVDGEHQDHYAVLGLSRDATSADIKRAYRLLARKYHPDVSKHSRAAELFKSIHHACQILSNETTRVQYDRVLRFRQDARRSYMGARRKYNDEYEDTVRVYRWYDPRQKMDSNSFRERYREWDEQRRERKRDSFRRWRRERRGTKEENVNEERGPFSEVLRSVFISLLLLQMFGSLFSLAFSTLTALIDHNLDAGYKVGYFVAFVLGGRPGIMLTMFLRFASWVCGKTSSGTVAVVVVAMWVGSNLARYTPLPQGALLTLLYMSIKLQADLK